MIPAELYQESGAQSRWGLMEAITDKKRQKTVAEEGFGTFSWWIGRDKAGGILVIESTAAEGGNEHNVQNMINNPIGGRAIQRPLRIHGLL